jgi:hypothetical protein
MNQLRKSAVGHMGMYGKSLTGRKKQYMPLKRVLMHFRTLQMPNGLIDK